jgi:hypothetical protein
MTERTTLIPTIVQATRLCSVDTITKTRYDRHCPAIESRHSELMLIEVTTFGLAPDIDRDALLAADHALQEELNSRRGFVRRTTAEGDAGWLVITCWWDAATADAAGELVAQHEFSALLRDVETRRYSDIGG